MMDICHKASKSKFQTRQIGRLILAIALLFGCAWIFFHLGSLGMHYEWQWNRVWRSFCQWTSQGFQAGPLMKGLLLTLSITALGFIFSAITGFVCAIMRLSPWPVCSALARTYVCLWRNTPLLLQLFFVYFLISPLFNLSPFWSALLALTAFEGAYVAELLRAAILSVPRAQWEAGLSLGFDARQCLLLIILPQAVRNGMPSFINQAITLLKDTSLVSAIAVADLTMRAQALVAETFLAFEVWLFAGFLYLIIAFGIALPGLWLEKRRVWR